MNRPAPRRAVDWRLLIHELRHVHRMTYADIGEQAGVNRHSVHSYYWQNTAPKHADGEALVALWMRVTGKGREVMPTEIVAVPYRRGAL